MPILERQNFYSVWTPLLFFFFLRLFTAPFFGLGVDEAHYLLYALHPALSYFDHPPLVGWLHMPLVYTIGASELTARIPPILLGAGTTFFAYNLVFELTDNQKASFWAAVGLNSSFIFGALFLMLLPDTILLFLLFLLINTFIRLLKTPSLKNYLLFGLILGLCGLSKYTAITFIFAILAYLIQTKNRALFMSKYTVMSVITAAITILPVMIWNFQNHFASFTYQGSHVAGGDSFSILTLGKNLLIEFVAYSPPLFIIAIYGFLKVFKNKKELPQILFWFGLFIVLFFMFTALKKPALPHWISPFFVLFIPVGIGFLYNEEKYKIIIYSVIFSLILTILIHLELVFKLGYFADLKSPFRDIYGWKESAKIAKNIKPIDSDIGVLNWSEGSRVSFYANEPIFVADTRYDQFDIWYDKNPIGRNYLFIETKSSKQKIADKCNCSELLKVGSYDAKINNRTVEGFNYILCKDFKGLK